MVNHPYEDEHDQPERPFADAASCVITPNPDVPGEWVVILKLKFNGADAQARAFEASEIIQEELSG